MNKKSLKKPDSADLHSVHGTISYELLDEFL